MEELATESVGRLRAKLAFAAELNSGAKIINS
jgi:hypothetical protein